MAKPKKKPHNTILACVAHNDPPRYRTRVVQTEEQKQVKTRSRRKAKLRKELEEV